MTRELGKLDLADEQLVTVFDALGDMTRLKILEVALEHGHVACSELDDMLDLAKSTISYHTKILNAAGLIHTHREGRFFRYTPTKLATAALPPLRSLLVGLESTESPVCGAPSLGDASSQEAQRALGTA